LGPEGPKFEAEGRERGGVLREGAESPFSTSVDALRAPKRVFWRQMRCLVNLGLLGGLSPSAPWLRLWY